MITFDKLKLVADISAVRDYDETRFEIIEKNGAVAAMKFYQETPFLLKIKLDFVPSIFRRFMPIIPALLLNKVKKGPILNGSFFYSL